MARSASQKHCLQRRERALLSHRSSSGTRACLQRARACPRPNALHLILAACRESQHRKPNTRARLSRPHWNCTCASSRSSRSAATCASTWGREREKDTFNGNEPEKRDRRSG